MEGNNQPLSNNSGAPTPITPPVVNTNPSAVNPTETNNSAGTTGTASAAPEANLSETKFMAALAYVGPLVFIPFFLKKEDSYVHYHVKQGLVVFSIGAIIWVLKSWFVVFYFMYNLLMIANLAVLVLSIIGIVNALKHQEKPLPFVGQFAHHFNF